jgi:hypothetical protein
MLAWLGCGIAVMLLACGVQYALQPPDTGVHWWVPYTVIGVLAVVASAAQ